jgi:hypothetical protein
MLFSSLEFINPERSRLFLPLNSSILIHPDRFRQLHDKIYRVITTCRQLANQFLLDSSFPQFYR